MRKKHESKVIMFVVVFSFILVSIIVFIKYIDYTNTNKIEIVRYDFEIYNIEYIQENLESFEKLCEYDLEHYSEYERIDDASIEIKYAVPQKTNSYYDERNALFNKLGVDRGFDNGVIYPNKETIVFKSNCGDYGMTLVYYKNGTGEVSLEPQKSKIGSHFVIDCFDLHPTIQ